MPVHDRKEQLLTAWTDFVNKGIVNNNWVRREIEDSWRRSRATDIDPVSSIVPEVSSRELEHRREAKRELLEISLPIMNNLLSFVAGSGFVVSMSDQDGVIIERIVDEGVTLMGKNGLFTGYSLKEEIVGANATGLALRLGRPIQVFATEHYIKALHSWTCSSAPIYGHSGEIVGTLTMNGTFEKVHSHTLGMVVAAVNAIEGQLKINIANQYQNTIVDSISEGLIAVDEKARITKINAAAAALLKVNVDTVRHSSINELLGCQNPISRSLQSGDIVNDEEYQAENGRRKTHCTISCRPIRNPQHKIVGLVAIIREIRAVKQLIQQMVGARARFVFDDLIGQNASYLKTVELAKRAAKSSSNVLLLGESGTGKEVFAQAIHNASKRSKGPFIAINCGAIPRELIASEMFGYSDGAFTGAKRGGNPGKFELAEGGTLFLDEIGEMPIELQASLLRVLQEKVVTRIGGTQVIPIDVKVIAATNKDLHKEVEKGCFRKDLYYRLNVLIINMVPLRSRKDDIVTLTRFFMEKITERLGLHINVLHPETLEALQRYYWPGNIRELENVIERAIHTASGDTLTLDCMPEEILSVSQIQSYINPARPEELSGDDIIIRRKKKNPGKGIILESLKRNDGNLSQAAKDLGISRPTLYSKLKKYGIELNDGKFVPSGNCNVLLLNKKANECLNVDKR
ncbi:sigma-54-dependent Fis family transcriptional regulator [Phosphitispora sp. TUW77]|uniref:sigma-54-dependent Fis family transcriptional regulator n=1 Tax=Phosphitispora sp. TUW77 TaxID=3152361 RepID=UPI003AB68E47